MVKDQIKCSAPQMSNKNKDVHSHYFYSVPLNIVLEVLGSTIGKERNKCIKIRKELLKLFTYSQRDHLHRKSNGIYKEVLELIYEFIKVQIKDQYVKAIVFLHSTNN